MKQVLLLQCSPNGAASVSRKLTDLFLAKYRHRNEGARIIMRDLVAEPVPHVSEEFVSAMFVPPANRTQNMNEALSLGFKLAKELQAADDIIISAPMYNRTVPSSLKAWIDHVVLPFETFGFGPNGQEGLLTGKTVYFIGSSGGVFSKGPGMEIDFYVPYVRHIMGFMGITDVRVIRAEGTAYDRETGIKLAEAEIDNALFGTK